MTTLGLMVRRLIEQIVRQEMSRTGAIEVELPILQPRELWDETGRWTKYMSAGIAFHLADRRGGEYILAPTAEEAVTSFARATLRTHRDLPLTLWQMSPKFRDEFRPRQGLIRGREFVMKDAYSFDVDERGMRLSYEIMDHAYQKVFTRCGFSFIKVEADSGAIGGSGSAEFMAITEFGEDVLLYCPYCGYGGNQERASAFFPPYPEVPLEDLQEIATPDIRTVEQLEKSVGYRSEQMVKTIVLQADGKSIIVSVRGDLEISEVKLANFLGATTIEIADAETVEMVTGAPVGFAGPINLYGQTQIPYYVDRSVRGLANFLCGANKRDTHYIGCNAGRDFLAIDRYYDLVKAIAGQYCAHCQKGAMLEKRGIELGHIFQLQQVYSQPMEATFIDVNGERVPYWMGCYGIGVSRIVQAIVEQSYDKRGIVWPLALTPFEVAIIPVTAEHLAAAEDLYELLVEAGVRVLLDDRPARIGEKLTDAELQGWPVQVLVGRHWDTRGDLEVRWRDIKNFDLGLFALQNDDDRALPTAIMTPEDFVHFINKRRSSHVVKSAI